MPDLGPLAAVPGSRQHPWILQGTVLGKLRLALDNTQLP